MMPSPFASAAFAGQVACRPSVKPSKCRQCSMSFGNSLAFPAIVRLSSLMVNVASPTVFNPVPVVQRRWMGDAGCVRPVIPRVGHHG
jgi:hypothetical protein